MIFEDCEERCVCVSERKVTTKMRLVPHIEIYTEIEYGNQSINEYVILDMYVELNEFCASMYLYGSSYAYLLNMHADVVTNLISFLRTEGLFNFLHACIFICCTFVALLGIDTYGDESLLCLCVLFQYCSKQFVRRPASHQSHLLLLPSYTN